MSELSAPEKKHDTRLSLHQDGVLANVAILYYKEGLTQNEIAQRLGVSRPTVINYLRLAREQNIVDIRINGASFSVSTVSRELREKYALADVYVADFVQEGEAGSTEYKRLVNRHVARVAAMALHDILQPGETIGVAWGETIQFLSEEVPYRLIEDLTVCQMIGSMTTPLVSTAESCAIRISSRLGAECYTLHAPAILSTPELAESLRSEPVIRDQLERFHTFDRTIFSVGNCDSDTPIVQSAITSPEEFDWYRAQGAAAVLCGRFINGAGDHIAGSMDDRMIGITLDELKAKQSGILVAGGKGKLNAIRATLNGGYVAHLVTDNHTARLLLDDDGAMV